MAPPPTLYEYYTSSGISAGLSTECDFTLNGKKITLFSGALHYFRVPPQYWGDRLRKFRAAGLNCVETYISWNVHEPEIGCFDFGRGGFDFSDFLDIESFLKLAQEEDLFVIVRPGPYICAEWDFGGLPSWLLREEMQIRTSDPKFMQYVNRYFKVLLPMLAKLQFTKGGPIIAFQIENEYGNTKKQGESVDVKYLERLKLSLQENGIVELLFTSDTPSNGFSGTLPAVLATANFQTDPEKELTLLRDYQPDKPLMVMEYWTGWFDHWSDKHHTRTTQAFADVLEDIFKMKSSVNMYMFHGGTNWGFYNGANIKDSTTDNSAFTPDTTSYDYDAPLSEAGDYTEKYYKVKELIKKYNKTVTKLPALPELSKRTVLPTVTLTHMLSLDDLISQSHKISSNNLQAMEKLNINNNSGQSYGYIVYRQANINIAANSTLLIEGHVCDTVLVLINGVLKSKIPKKREALNEFGFWRLKNSSLNLGENEYKNATLDLFVENFGRSNYGKLEQFNQLKGLWHGNVLLNDVILTSWTIIPLEFKKNWTSSLKIWKERAKVEGPTLYRGLLEIDEFADTYIDLRKWRKGFVLINGFNLGRYWNFGPQQTLYLPAPFLKKQNEILIFEHYEAHSEIRFVENPIFETIE